MHTPNTPYTPHNGGMRPFLYDGGSKDTSMYPLTRGGYASFSFMDTPARYDSPYHSPMHSPLHTPPRSPPLSPPRSPTNPYPFTYQNQSSSASLSQYQSPAFRKPAFTNPTPSAYSSYFPPHSPSSRLTSPQHNVSPTPSLAPNTQNINPNTDFPSLSLPPAKEYEGEGWHTRQETFHDYVSYYAQLTKV
jgi:hypothetical protein